MHRCRCNECAERYRDPRGPTENIIRYGCYANYDRLVNGVWFCDFINAKIKTVERRHKFLPLEIYDRVIADLENKEKGIYPIIVDGKSGDTVRFCLSKRLDFNRFKLFTRNNHLQVFVEVL